MLKAAFLFPIAPADISFTNIKKCSHFLWQRNYYERIIRDEKSLNLAREYIEANPYKWSDDLYFVD